MDRNKVIKTASIIGIAGNAILAIAKIIIGMVSGSVAVFGDGLDTLTDIFISLITLIVSIIITRPPDREHPYGHFRAETIATSILAFIMFFIGGQLTLSTADQLFNHEAIAMPGILAIYVTVFSIIGKIALSISQQVLGKKADSAMLIANGKNMRNDVLTSGGVLAGLACAFYFNLPVVDKYIAIIIGLWIMVSAIRIFIGTLTELMDGENNKELYEKIFEAVKNTSGITNPHRVRIRKLGAFYTVDIDVEVDGNLKVCDAHTRVKLFEAKIRQLIPNIYDIVVHIEPHGNVEQTECYGLTEETLNKNSPDPLHI